VDDPELEELNDNTFRAEAKESIGERSWRTYLEQVLADDFMLRRSAAEKADEDRTKMLDTIDKADNPPKRSIVPGSVRVWSSQEVGVVVSTVTMPIKGETKAFENVKVFTREPPDRWRCVYWQVSPKPLRAAEDSGR
jgi:hypothetical protein